MNNWIISCDSFFVKKIKLCKLWKLVWNGENPRKGLCTPLKIRIGEKYIFYIFGKKWINFYSPEKENICRNLLGFLFDICLASLWWSFSIREKINENTNATLNCAFSRWSHLKVLESLLRLKVEGFHSVQQFPVYIMYC